MKFLPIDYLPQVYHLTGNCIDCHRTYEATISKEALEMQLCLWNTNGYFLWCNVKQCASNNTLTMPFLRLVVWSRCWARLFFLMCPHTRDITMAIHKNYSTERWRCFFCNVSFFPLWLGLKGVLVTAGVYFSVLLVLFWLPEWASAPALYQLAVHCAVSSVRPA